MLIQSVPDVVNLLVHLEKTYILDYALLDEGDSAKSGVDVIVSHYLGEKGDEIGQQDLSFIHVVIVAQT